MKFLHITGMSIKSGDIVICIKERKDTNKDGVVAIIFKENVRYKILNFSMPNNKGDSYWVSDGAAFMQQFFDGVEPGDFHHPNMWEYFITEKELLNKKLKKVKNA